jgi:hypothetical protein
MDPQSLSKALNLLDAWLETMRNGQGYGGPVAHWWQSCLLYSGPMMDWRYEGIVCGYLHLYRAAAHPAWLERALAAGHDLVRAQLPTGRFWNSSFEVGPIEGGTPHEAAADIALLELARLLRAQGDPRWEGFFRSAERNLRQYHLDCLWDGTAFRDQEWNRTRVPNKNATILEALLLYEELGGSKVEKYIMGAAETILANQVQVAGLRQGATVHAGTGPHRLAIGIYTARCAAALVRLYERDPKEQYIESARAMLAFLLRLITEEGTRFGVYPDQRWINCPTWVSASGDVLRALIALQPYADVPEAAVERLAGLLLASQTPAGGIPTARGLGRKGLAGRGKGLPDFRDVLPVAGWCDKAFRALAMLAGPEAVFTGISPQEASLDCRWKGRECRFHEDAREMELVDARRGEVIYAWRKVECYPTVYRL